MCEPVRVSVDPWNEAKQTLENERCHYRSESENEGRSQRKGGRERERE